MADITRFTPYSLDAFKRTARDLQRAYSLGLQESQETLARLYGYPHLHALQEHLKTNPEPGFDGDSKPWFVDSRALSNFYGLVDKAKILPRSSRISVEDLGLFEAPKERQEIMRFQKEIDAAIDGSAPPELNAQPSDYVWWEDRHDDFGPKPREGIFRLTKKGSAIWKACNHLNEILDFGQPSGFDARQLRALHEEAVDAMHRLLKLFPYNPYVKANWIWTCSEGREELDLELAKELWPLAQQARKEFESVMSHRFSGYIEPKLVGFDAENGPYFAVLYFGAHFAATLGLDAEALKWCRRSLRFCKNDRFGIRFLAESLKNGQAD